jgi:hypothetical protein
VAEEQVNFSEGEHDVLSRVVERMGFGSVQEATEFLARLGLAKRANRPVKLPASVVLPFRPRSKA